MRRRRRGRADSAVLVFGFACGVCGGGRRGGGGGTKGYMQSDLNSNALIVGN